MREFQVRVRNLRGLHARAASRLVQTAGRFQSRIELIKDEIRTDAKSILGVLLLAAAQGTELTVRIDGEDEQQAEEAIKDLFQRGFYEQRREPAETPASDESR